ncbi:MAG: beta-galactosidase [Planctomycetes bacterium]|nr:beta-galactosidase [Planctomycetota bacterium]
MKLKLVVTLVAVAAMACSAAVAAEPRVKLTETGGLLVDGKPFLPIMVWAQPSSTLEMHKGLGMNTMHPGEGEDKDPAKAYLDKLQAAGMMGLLNIEAFRDDLKDHPAVLAWTVEHEPDMAENPAYEPDLLRGGPVIWIEGEAAKESTMKRNAWLDKEKLQLSGKRWLTAEKDGAGSATWEFEVTQAGAYTLWVREFTKNWANPTRWTLDEGQPQETPRSLRPLENVTLGGGQGVAWAEYGKVELAAGKHTLKFEIVAGRTVGKPDAEPNPEAIFAIDAICLTQAESHPAAKPLEPTPKRLPEIEKANYEKLKAAKPDALAWNVLTSGCYGGYQKLPMRYYEEFVKWTDVVSFDHYPITGWNQPGRLPEVGLVTRKYVQMCGKGKPVWTIVEASDQDLSWTAPETRGPTAAEMRAQVFSSIACGAKGIGYFTIAFNPFRWNNLTDEIKAELKRTNGELTELAGPIVLGDTDKALTVTGDETDDKSAEGRAIHAIRKDYEGKTYVIAVNITRAAVTPTLKVDGATAAKATVWKESREVAVSDGGFSDAFEPLAVHVYLLQ